MCVCVCVLLHICVCVAAGRLVAAGTYRISQPNEIQFSKKHN